MSLLHTKTKRRILPRWRTSAITAQSAELLATKPARVIVNDDGTHLREAKYTFERNPSIGGAADLIAAASMAGETDIAKHAASFVVQNSSQSPQTLLALSYTMLGEPLIDTRSNGSVIAHTRKLLRLHPDNPVLWSDMARHFASHGNRREAGRCIKVAVQLAPDHRWILRIASRFLVHSGQEEEAHRLLARHQRTPKDPWLIAAELATAQVALRPPKFWRQANDLIKRGGVAPLHLSELATAVGMFELESGNSKKARKLVEFGLRDPTENTLAQVSWAREAKHLKGANALDELVRNTSNAFEADFRLKWLTGDLLGAMAAGEQWAYDEPFAARPVSNLAFLASILDDYERTIQLAEQVSHLDGHMDLTLEMNTMFAKMSSSRLSMEKDHREIVTIHTRLMALADEKNAYHAIANLALWHYRFGKAEIGAILYKKAIETLEKMGALDQAALAAAYAAREAILVRQPDAQALLEKAQILAKRSHSALAGFYVRKLDDLILNPENAREILSPNAVARYLSASKPKSVAFRMFKGPDGPVLVVPSKPEKGPR